MFPPIRRRLQRFLSLTPSMPTAKTQPVQSPLPLPPELFHVILTRLLINCVHRFCVSNGADAEWVCRREMELIPKVAGISSSLRALWEDILAKVFSIPQNGMGESISILAQRQLSIFRDTVKLPITRCTALQPRAQNTVNSSLLRGYGVFLAIRQLWQTTFKAGYTDPQIYESHQHYINSSLEVFSGVKEFGEPSSPRDLTEILQQSVHELGTLSECSFKLAECSSRLLRDIESLQVLFLCGDKAQLKGSLTKSLTLFESLQGDYDDMLKSNVCGIEVPMYTYQLPFARHAIRSVILILTAFDDAPMFPRNYEDTDGSFGPIRMRAHRITMNWPV